MPDILQVILLGVIEGVTEFLPISSTGHLLIAEHWLGARSDLFNIGIQAGAILAVVLIYRKRLLELSLQWGRPENRDYLFKLSASFLITAIGGFVAKKLGLKLPETVAPVALALIAGGIIILLVERRPEGGSAGISWNAAIWVGLAQILAAIFPGTSRSAATIFAAMIAGQSRVAATEFAFLVGIPTMFAATGYESLKLLKDGGAAHEDWTALLAGSAVSAVVAFAAVKWLLVWIQTHRFTPFAWYRIALGAALLALV